MSEHATRPERRKVIRLASGQYLSRSRRARRIEASAWDGMFELLAHEAAKAQRALRRAWQ
jgi:hypothetical protein